DAAIGAPPKQLTAPAAAGGAMVKSAALVLAVAGVITAAGKVIGKPVVLITVTALGSEAAGMMALPRLMLVPGCTSRPVILPTIVVNEPVGPLLPVLPSGSVRVTIAGAPAVVTADIAAPPLPRKPAGAGGTVDLMKVSIEPGTPAASAATKFGGIAPGPGTS